jgi:predicted permease
MRDIKDALRALGASRGSTAVALILLTVGIGASTAVFSVVDAVLRGLPFAHAERLVDVSARDLRIGGRMRVPPQDYLDWKAQQDVFEDLAAAASGPDLVISEEGRTEALVRSRVTASLFDLLRVQPRVGRAFTAAHEVEGHHLVLVLSDGLWKRRFGGDPAVIGRTMTFESGSYEILGIMPPGFTYPLGTEKPAEIYTPYVIPARQRVRGGSRSFALQVVGRLKPGVSLDTARARMEQIHQGLAAQFPAWFPNRGIEVTDLRESLIGEARSWMLLLIGAVGFLLLLVCVNVSGLALARGLARAREIGIRAALGATHWQIARVIVLESVLLSVAGAACGAALAYGGVAILRTAVPASLPRVATVGVDGRVLAAAGLAALLAAVVCSLLPALKFSRADAAHTLRHGRSTGESGGGAGAAGKYLVIAEVGLSVLLLVGAGLFVSSFNRLMRVDLGLDYHNVLTVPAQVRFASFEQRTKAAGRAAIMLPAVLDRVKTLPGVEEAAAISGGVPLSGGSIRSSMQVRGRATQLDDGVVDVHHVTADYFKVLRIPLVQGRQFSDSDAREAPPVVILSESAARKYFPDGTALGGMVGFEPAKDLRVVGIVGNLRLDGPERPQRPEAYIPLAQGIVTGADLVVRTAADPRTVAAAVKTAIWSIEPGAVIPEVQSLEGALQRRIAPRKFNMLLFGILGVLAIAIAATGIYGLLAQQVAQREQEIGLRMALGAVPASILALVVGRAARYLIAGVTLGLAGAWSLGRFVEAFLFGVTPYDVMVYAAGGSILLLTGLIAALIPARRAMKLDPATTLKAGG